MPNITEKGGNLNMSYYTCHITLMLPFQNVTFVVKRLSSSFIEILTKEDFLVRDGREKKVKVDSQASCNTSSGNGSSGLGCTSTQCKIFKFLIVRATSVSSSGGRLFCFQRLTSSSTSISEGLLCFDL